MIARAVSRLHPLHSCNIFLELLLIRMDPSKVSPDILQQDKGPLLVITIWVFGSLALIVVCLNFWTRLKVLHQSGLEDIFVLLAWVGRATKLSHSISEARLTRSRCSRLSTVP